jgi:hypothetical protein
MANMWIVGKSCSYFSSFVRLTMPSTSKNWCAHPVHTETLRNGGKRYTKFGPKPNYPIASRRITLALANNINKTCEVILKDPMMKLNENHGLCTKCFDEEHRRFKAVEMNVMEIDDYELDENVEEDDAAEELEKPSSLMKAEEEYAIEMLNDAFKFFRLESVAR